MTTGTLRKSKQEVWDALSKHALEINDCHMRDWFETDPKRSLRYLVQQGGITLDFSRHLINTKTLSLLQALAQSCDLAVKISSLYQGKITNPTEWRPALHTALRDQNNTNIVLNGKNIAECIRETKHKMACFTKAIHNNTVLGITGKPITTIVTLGIGGSLLGVKLCCDALKNFAKKPVQCHFISSIDPDMMQDVLSRIDPAATLFVIASKTLKTLETVSNAQSIINWMKERYGDAAVQKHFVAITADIERAQKFNILEGRIFPIWDWVGGRYSIWSAMGLPLMLLIGHKAFDEFLQGAYEMDCHFKNAPFLENMPFLLALLSVWYINFFHAKAHAIIPYAYRLRYLPQYLQQLEMESNGKSTNLNHEHIAYLTGAVIFGEEGCHGQHAYHQLLHQGQHLIPVDFILVGHPSSQANQQNMLIASAISQAQALMQGKTYYEAHHALLKAGYSSDRASQLAMHQVNPGNRPSHLIWLQSLTPKNLGALLALYEHKVYAQSVIWDINPFDQWGVELGKELLPKVLREMSRV